MASCVSPQTAADCGYSMLPGPYICVEALPSENEDGKQQPKALFRTENDGNPDRRNPGRRRACPTRRPMARLPHSLADQHCR